MVVKRQLYNNALLRQVCLVSDNTRSFKYCFVVPLSAFMVFPSFSFIKTQKLRFPTVTCLHHPHLFLPRTRKPHKGQLLEFGKNSESLKFEHGAEILHHKFTGRGEAMHFLFTGQTFFFSCIPDFLNINQILRVCWDGGDHSPL